MSWQPEVLRPDPDPFYVRELRRIDPDLRIVWGFDRYFVKQWAIERKIEPARYFAMYASLFEQDLSRFVDQPIFDTAQPEHNEWGEQTGFKQVGSRKYDLAPEYEHVLFTPVLNGRIITELRRIYAEDRNLSTEEIALQKRNEYEARDKAQKQQRTDAAMEGFDQAWRAYGKRLHGGPPKSQMPGTEL